MKGLYKGAELFALKQLVESTLTAEVVVKWDNTEIVIDVHWDNTTL